MYVYSLGDYCFGKSTSSSVFWKVPVPKPLTVTSRETDKSESFIQA